MWRLWCKAIGSKDNLTDREADRVAMIRTALVSINVVCALVIIAYDIFHW